VSAFSLSWRLTLQLARPAPFSPLRYASWLETSPVSSRDNRPVDDPRSDRTTAVSGGAQCSSAIADMTLIASERLPMSTALVRTSDWNCGPRKRLCNENLHRMSEQIRVDGVQDRLATMLAHPDEENACWVA